MVRTTIGGLAVAAWLAAVAAPALAAPGNDDFENARALGAGPVSVDGTLAGATRQPGDPTPAAWLAVGAAVGDAVDVWYSLTPTTTGPVSVAIPARQGPVDAPASVYTGADRDRLVPVPSSDDDHWWGRTRFDAVAGQTYRIMVSGWRPEGTFTLRAGPATPPSNDAFADARHVRVPGFYHDNIEDATVELGEPSPTGKETAWFRIRPRHNGRLTLEAGGAGCEATVGAFTGSRIFGLHRIAERRFVVRFYADRGRTYRVRVSCFGGYVGEYTLDVSDGSIEGKGVHMTVEPGQTLDSVRHHGLRLDVGARRKVGASIDLRVDRRTARRLGSPDRVIGHLRGTFGSQQDAPATIRLERGARRALAHRGRLNATLRLALLDHAPNRVMYVPVHLRRAAA